MRHRERYTILVGAVRAWQLHVWKAHHHTPSDVYETCMFCDARRMRRVFWDAPGAVVDWSWLHAWRVPGERYAEANVEVTNERSA